MAEERYITPEGITTADVKNSDPVLDHFDSSNDRGIEYGYPESNGSGIQLKYPLDDYTVKLLKSFIGSGSTPGGVSSIIAGTNITVSAPSGNVTISASTTSGVTVAAGTAISVTGGPAYTINNTGVTRANAGTAISVSSTTGSVTINNTGVTSLVAGTNITLSGATGAVTVSAPSVTTTSSISAIARDASSTGTLSGTTSFTIAHTCTGNNRLLVVGIEGHLISTDIVTAVTYNGTAMTRLAATINSGGESLWTYYLLAPSSGSHNIAITTSADPAAGGGALYVANGSYTNVNQGGFPQNQASSANPSAASIAYSVSVGSANPYEWGIVVNGSSSTGLALQAGSGNGYAGNAFSSTSRCILSDTNGSINPAAVLTTGISGSGTPVLMYQQMFVDPAPATSNTNPYSQIFTTSGTFTGPTSTSFVYVTMVAGGGGGGASLQNATGRSGAGGGSGGYRVKFKVPVTASSTYAVVVGAKGLGGTTSALSGTAGTLSSFVADNGTHTVTGGGGGTGGTASGAGGTAGSPFGVAAANAGVQTPPSAGAESLFGEAGALGTDPGGGPDGTVAGSATGDGAGGGGGAPISPTGSHFQLGGDGSPGLVFIEW